VAKTPGQRGAIGRWLVEQRHQRGWARAEDARRALGRLGGIHLAQSVYAEYESGRRVPTDTVLDRLIDFYGSRPHETIDGREALGRIAAALEEQVHQTATLNGLLAALLKRDGGSVDSEIPSLGRQRKRPFSSSARRPAPTAEPTPARPAS
jgi:transcriptional regulator with XRE-family HTH domain